MEDLKTKYPQIDITPVDINFYELKSLNKLLIYGEELDEITSGQQVHESIDLASLKWF